MKRRTVSEEDKMAAKKERARQKARALALAQSVVDYVAHVAKHGDDRAFKPSEQREMLRAAALAVGYLELKLTPKGAHRLGIEILPLPLHH